MKKVLNKYMLFLIIFLIAIILIPSKTYAVSYKSDFIKLEDVVMFETDEFEIDLEYSIFYNVPPTKLSSISGPVRSKGNNIYYCHYIIYYFNSNKEEIGAVDGYKRMTPKTSSQQYYISGSLEEKDMYSDYKLDDICYYKLFIEPAEQEIVENYMYDRNKTAVDPITDFDTVLMVKKDPNKLKITTRPNNTNKDNDTDLSDSVDYLNTSDDTMLNDNEDYLSENSDADFNESYDYSNSNYDYVIESYDIDMVVNENNTFDITETITAYFNKPKHGIFRKIPQRNIVKRLDGTESKNYAQISNISVSENYTISNEYGYKVIKIGDANKVLTGSQTYTIKYTYNIGKDPLKDADELYFNLIGDEWDTSINNISFKITMPKSFDESLLGFAAGILGSTDNYGVNYEVDGEVITGNVDRTLSPSEALTVRLTLPDEYFVGAGLKIDNFSIVVIIICVVGVLIAFILWLRYGKDEPVIETVEFYPPEGYNSAEVGFLYEGVANKKSIISLLIFLANKGYLKIEDVSNIKTIPKLNNENKEDVYLKIQELENEIRKEKAQNINSPKIKILENLLDIYINIDKPIEYELTEQEEKNITSMKVELNGKFKITKLKNYDGKNKYEKMFFEGLFDSYSNKTSVTDKDLYNKFYLTLNRIERDLNSNKIKDKIFKSTARGISKLLLLLNVIIYILINFKPVSEIFNTITAGVETVSVMLPALLILLMLTYIMIFGKSESIIHIKKTTKIELIFKVLIATNTAALFAFTYFIIIYILLTQNIMYVYINIIGIASIIAITIFRYIMPNRTPYGNKIFGKVKGFRRFLEVAEKEQLENLVMKNPEYFYNILPYTYALGVSDVWIKQFETIAFKAPDWYEDKDDFDMKKFEKFIDSTMDSAYNSMTSEPRSVSNSGSSSSSSSWDSDSDSGSSGGGYSGGGSGGGGGGSW